MTARFKQPLYPYRRVPDQDAVICRRHQVVIVGAGPVGLAAAIDLAQQGIQVVVLDENDRVSSGSRAICFSKRMLEIADRLGIGDQLVEKGVTWDKGRVFNGNHEAYAFDLLPEGGQNRPAFINLQQYYLEVFLVDRLRELQAEGADIELRGGNKVSSIGTHDDHVALEIDTKEGPYNIEADWLVACDGAASPSRRMLGCDFNGRVFEDNFLIADVIMEADFPTERWFWFNPPFNPGQSALLHKQPDNVWRIDLQLGWDIDREAETRPANVVPRLQAMLGKDTNFQLEWVSVYTFQCRRMERFLHGRVIFAGDAAHQVSPFGARGANSGFQDTDNLCWKLAMVIREEAPESLLETYNDERVAAADENILNSTRSTDFITPKSKVSRVFRNAVLDLAKTHAFARPLVNSGRLSTPAIYDGSSLNFPEIDSHFAIETRPGAPAIDAPWGDGWLLQSLGVAFTVLYLGGETPAEIPGVATLHCGDPGPELRARYLGEETQGVILFRPDQHVAARWRSASGDDIQSAILRAKGGALC